jgi:hypothetical protein
VKGEIYWHLGYAFSIAAALVAGLLLLSTVITAGIVLAATAVFAAVVFIKCKPSTFLFGTIKRFFGKDLRDDEDSTEGDVR